MSTPIFDDAVEGRPYRLPEQLGAATVYQLTVDDRPMMELIEWLEALINGGPRDAEVYAMKARMRAEMRAAFPWLKV